MAKQELIDELNKWIDTLFELQTFLVLLKSESLVKHIFVHGVIGFLLTAVDYLAVNLEEIRNRVRMA